VSEGNRAQTNPRRRFAVALPGEGNVASGCSGLVTIGTDQTVEEGVARAKSAISAVAQAMVGSVVLTPAVVTAALRVELADSVRLRTVNVAGIVWPDGTGDVPGLAQGAELGKIEMAVFAGLFVAAIAITMVVQKFSNNKIEFEKEKALTSDEQLKKECDTIIQSQQGWLSFELVDALSDIANGVMAVVESKMSLTFLVLFIIIGVFSVFAGINSVVKRRQVINGVRKIRDGDEETMKKFKDGAKGGIITVDNPLLQWALVTWEIHVSELAATNGVLEDFPSFVLNVVSLVMAFSRSDFEASPQFYVSFGALLVSCITGGRKTYLRDKLKALRARKGELEQQTKKMSGGRASIIVGGSLKMIAKLDVEGGELRGAEGVGKGPRVVPVIGGEEIKAAEGMNRDELIATLLREKKEAAVREKEAAAREKEGQAREKAEKTKREAVEAELVALKKKH